METGFLGVDLLSVCRSSCSQSHDGSSLICNLYQNLREPHCFSRFVNFSLHYTKPARNEPELAREVAEAILRETPEQKDELMRYKTLLKDNEWQPPDDLRELVESSEMGETLGT